MESKSIVAAGYLFAALAGCLCLSVAALGQATGPLAQVSSGHRPLTPQQKAEQAAELAPLEALDHAAAVALDAGDYATAEADARQAGGTFGFTGQTLAAALAAQGKTEEALEQYRWITQSYAPPNVRLPYALLLLNTGQWAQAVQNYELALPYVGKDTDPVRSSPAFSPDDPQPVALAAAIHLALGASEDGTYSLSGHSLNDRALAEYGKALALAPGWGLANYYYGQGLEKLGRRKEARVTLERAMRLAKGNVKAAAQKALAKAKKPA